VDKPYLVEAFFKLIVIAFGKLKNWSYSPSMYIISNLTAGWQASKQTNYVVLNSEIFKITYYTDGIMRVFGI